MKTITEISVPVNLGFETSEDKMVFHIFSELNIDVAVIVKLILQVTGLLKIKSHLSCN